VRRYLIVFSAPDRCKEEPKNLRHAQKRFHACSCGTTDALQGKCFVPQRELHQCCHHILCVIRRNPYAISTYNGPCPAPLLRCVAARQYCSQWRAADTRLQTNCDAKELLCPVRVGNFFFLCVAGFVQWRPKRRDWSEPCRHVDGITVQQSSGPGVATDVLDPQKTLFTSRLDLDIRKKPVECFLCSMALCGAETWTFRKIDQKYPKSFEMWCWRWVVKISWTDRVKRAK
jgi:hypothetical protein